MTKLIKTMIAGIIALSATASQAADTVYCANEKYGTELYLKDGKTLKFVNLANEYVAMTPVGDMLHSDEVESVKHVAVDGYHALEIKAMVDDHNFEWEVTLTVNVESDGTVDVHMIDNDAYMDEYEYTLVCDKELSIR